MFSKLSGPVASAVLGLVVGILFHFVLYRMGLPLEPFIYQAF